MNKEIKMDEEKTESPFYSPSMSPNRKAFFRKKNPNQKRSNNSEYIMILLEKEPMQRTKTEIRILSEYLSERFEFFKKFKNEPIKLEKLVSVLHLETFKPNEKIIKFGEEGDKFYILLQGKVNIYKPSYLEKKMTLQNYIIYLHKMRNEDKEESKLKRILDKNNFLQLDMPKLLSLPITSINSHLFINVFVEEEEKLGEFYDGFAFGEIALIKKTKRNATIKAKQICKLVSIHKNDYNKIIRELEEKRLEKILGDFKKTFPLFKYWTLSLLIKLMNCFCTFHLMPGEYLYKQDDESDSIYIIESGKFEIYSFLSLGWKNDFLEYIRNSESNLIYFLSQINSPLKENELYNIIINAKHNCLKSPMKYNNVKKNKITISNPPIANIEDLEKEKEDTFSPLNLFKIKIRETSGKEVLGYCDSLEMKSRLCCIKCIEEAKIQKIKLFDFLMLINLNPSKENKKLLMDLIAKKKRYFYLQILKAGSLKLGKEKIYLENEFNDFLEGKGKFEEKEKNNNVIDNDNKNNYKNNINLSKISSKKTIELNDHYLNIKPLREFTKKNNKGIYHLHYKKNKNVSVSIPNIKNNKLNINKSKTSLFEKNRNATMESNLSLYNSKNGISFSTSSLFNIKTDISKSIKEIPNFNLIKNSQFINYKNNKPNSFYCDIDNFSSQKSSRIASDSRNDLFKSEKKNKKHFFNVKSFKRNIDTNSEFLRTQISKLTGMKRFVPKKEINYTIYNENDINLIKIYSESNIDLNENNRLNKVTKCKKKISDNFEKNKKFPKIITEIDLKDFRSIRKKNKHFLKYNL